MTRRQLKRRIRGAWGRYIATLKQLCLGRGAELHGIEAAHKLIGAPADAEAYSACSS